MAKKKLKERENLTNEEMLKIDNFNLEVKSVELEIQSLNFKKQLLQIQIDKKIEELSNGLEFIKAKRKEFNDKIKEEFNIESETWGFDPLTGEVRK